MTDEEFDTYLETWFSEFEFEEEEDNDSEETENEPTIPQELIKKSFNGNEIITFINYN